MVGYHLGRLSCRSCAHAPEDSILAAQRLDDARARARLDQHQNNSGSRFLWYRNSDRFGQTMARKGSYGSMLKTRLRYLPHYAKVPSGRSFDKTVLVILLGVSRGRVFDRALVFHERTKKILASSNHSLPRRARHPRGFHIRDRGGAVHLHVVLDSA